MQKLREENYGQLTATGNQLTLAPSLLNFGGRQRRTPELSALNTNLDTGVIAASKLYYVYAVYDGVFSLVMSLSEKQPVGFNRYRKVGAFWTDGNTDILQVENFGINNLFEKSADIELVNNGTSNINGVIRVTRSGNIFTLSSVGNFTHDNATQALSAPGVIPEWATPSLVKTNVYEHGGSETFSVAVLRDGSFFTAYRDSALVNKARTSTLDRITLSYTLNDAYSQNINWNHY